MNKLKKICLGAIIVFILYYIFCIICTHNIMEKADSVLSGEEIITDTKSPWYSMGFHKKYYPEAVKVKGNAYRVFSCCGLKKGYIFIWYKVEYFDINGNVVFNDKGIQKLTIEKNNGEWILIDTYIKP